MPQKVSPNERCPCGSGQKYKRCCMNADRAAPPSAARATGDSALADAEMLRLTSAVGRRDSHTIAASIELLHPLFRRGGPLESIRFEQSKFSQAFVAAAEELGAPTEERKQALLQKCVEASCTAADARGLFERMEQIRQGGKVSPKAAGALEFWLASTEVALESDDLTFARSPLLIAIAATQAEELTGPAGRVVELVSSLADALQDGSMSVGEVRKHLAEHPEDLVQALEAFPELAASAEAFRGEALAELPALLGGRGALKVLTCDEVCLLTAELARIREKTPDVEAARLEMHDYLDACEITELVLERMRLAAHDPALPARRRKKFGRAELILGGDPAAFLLTAVREHSVEVSSAEHACFTSNPVLEAALEALATHYESLGLLDRAARARRAAAITKDLPTTARRGS
ncbi:MAG: SEC-C domain-containing protein [Deltaproteobacteria bacterium]|nr:SEC-C domain-containing protein [Deltaproteobacteria bacterium]